MTIDVMHASVLFGLGNLSLFDVPVTIVVVFLGQKRQKLIISLCLSLQLKNHATGTLVETHSMWRPLAMHC